MSELSRELDFRSIDGHGRNAVRQIEDGKSAADDGDWFAKAAQSLLPHKPGTILYLSTGLGDERLCQKYAAGKVRPPAYFLRALLRSEQGLTWLEAVMDGSDIEWWRDMQPAIKLCRQYRLAER